MDVINDKWIRRHLKGDRGEKARLAQALGIPAPMVSRIISGERRVQPEEIPAVLRFFGKEGPKTELTPPGFSEGDATPFTHDRKAPLSMMVRAVAPNARNPVSYKAGKDLIGFGILKGDTLAVELGSQPQTGDIIIFTQTKDDVTATYIRRWVESHLIEETPTKTPLPFDPEDQSTAVLGVVRGTFRTHS